MNRRNKRQKNKGAAMIVATVVGIVVAVFVLSLLLVAYSLFASAARRTTQLQCKELAKSVSRELGEEVMKPDYDSYEEQMAAAGNENNLWFFLRYNLWQGDTWPYYYKDDKTDEEVTGHTLEDSTRYFTIDVTGDDTWTGMADQILISMYWEIESDDPASETDKSLTVLHIRTEVTKGDCGYAMEKAYSLNVADFDSEAEEEKLEGFSNASVNPNGRQIDTNENWMWAYD